jgi:hypothetical protein
MFGQFINHDFEDNAKILNWARVWSLRINVTQNDLLCFYRPGSAPIPGFRCGLTDPQLFIDSRYSAGEISSESGVFEVVNNATSYLDLHLIYGRNSQTNIALRTLHDGKLKTDNYDIVYAGKVFNFTNLLPRRLNVGLPVDTLFGFEMPPNEVWTQDDTRTPENVALSMFHLLFTREHNRLCEELKIDHPNWNDDRLFEEARRLNIAYYQHIIRNEYLPNALGEYFIDNYIKDYRRYDRSVDASTSMAFASAAFRYGHSALTPYFAINKCGQTYYNGATNVTTTLPFLGQSGGPFTPLRVLASAESYENVARGLINTRTLAIDNLIDINIRSIHNINGGTDLMALDMERARINGLPNYLRLRKTYHEGNRLERRIYGLRGCPRHLEDSTTSDLLACFTYITNESVLAAKLQQLYGKINNIDAIVGMYAEPKVGGTSFGSTMGSIIADQYSRSIKGDRFWYQNRSVFTREEINSVSSVTMQTLFGRNFNATLPVNPFRYDEGYKSSLESTC